MKKRIALISFLLFLLLVCLSVCAQVPRGAGPGRFTVVVLPDTQAYSWLFPDILDEQIRWIVDNTDSLNIKMVLHLGDLVEKLGETRQWENASRSLSMLDGKVPYLVLPGNHDVCKTYEDPKRPVICKEFDFTNYDKYFGYSRFKDYPWYKGSYPPKTNRNSYAVIEVDGLRLGFLSLMDQPSPDVLDWAKEVVSANRDRLFVLATHDYVSAWSISKGTHSNTIGTGIWDKLVKDSSNIFLATNGHFVPVAYRPEDAHCTRTRADGSVVHEIVSNYQSEPPDPATFNPGKPSADPNNLPGQNGKLRYYVFSPAEKKIRAYTCSPHLRKYYDDPYDEQYQILKQKGLSQFELPYDFGQAARPQTQAQPAEEALAESHIPWQSSLRSSTFVHFRPSLALIELAKELVSQGPPPLETP